MSVSTKENIQVYSMRTIPISARVFFLQINEIQGRCVKGIIVHLLNQEISAFDGIGDAVLQMDEIMNKWNYPETSTALRNFKSKKTIKTLQKDKWNDWSQSEQDWNKNIISENSNPRMSSYIIEVLYRQNSSWQGKITWHSPDKRNHIKYFRSVLELMHLIQSSL